ncbi:OmpA family protein [Yoonia sp.]|uniref:OmpA family protein n=1 Tax=Yoonia sp. TaxID=2212373 RepID=UPI003F6BB071
MRLSAIFLRLGAFACAGYAAFAAAQTTVAVVEGRSVQAVQESLLEQGYSWAAVQGDGLQVILEGQAPTEVLRFRAISAAGAMVDASRIIDNLSVADSAEITPPQFAIEILRNDSGVSLIGLIPASSDRDRLAGQITDIADGQPVTDLLESGDYPTPETWRDAMRYALRALEMLPRSKISVGADHVTVNAIADSPAEKRQLETALSRNMPEGVRIAISINAPRPVISPFTTRFILDETGAKFDACAADTETARDMILAAASAAGFSDKANCTLALGAPSRTWGDAVAMSIEAISALKGGTVTISDTDITLVAPMGTDQSIFDDVVGALDNALPDTFALAAELPQPPETTPDGVPQFTATRSPEGEVQLRGRIPDEVTNMVTENYAIAKFGQSSITMRTRIVPGLPQGWSVRVLAAIEALSKLSNGAVIVEPTRMLVRGNTGNTEASAEISRLLIEKLGQSSDFEIDVTYVEQLDPIAALPTPEECIDQIKAITDDRKITFDPSSAQLTADTQLVVDDIADILKACGDLRIRVAGYTDSQGREVMNQQLSQDRADAILTALRARRVPVSTFEAVGFGEENPIADNDTEEGREANRRIEFNLIVPEPAPDEINALDEIAQETPLEIPPSE